jgi:hypothetical protein
MTPDEIRAKKFDSDDGTWECATQLQEIAAQLAEQNEQLRKNFQLTEEFRAEERSERKKRSEVLEAASGGLNAYREYAENLPQPVKLIRPGAPPEVVHLGCLICDENGHHIATNDGRMVDLDAEEAKRLLAILAPPAADVGKPQ